MKCIWNMIVVTRASILLFLIFRLLRQRWIGTESTVIGREGSKLIAQC